MKKCIILFILALFCTNVYSETNTSQIPKKLIVKKNLMILMPFGMTNEMVDRTVIYFDNEGKTNSLQNFSRFNESLWRYEFRYNNFDKQIGKTEYGRQGILKNFYITRYDVLGQKIQYSVQSAMGKTISKIEYLYNSRGLLTKEKFFDQNTRNTSNIVYLYNNNETLTNRTVYSKKGVILEGEAYIFDTNNNRRYKNIYFGQNGQIAYWNTYRYYELGKLKSKSTYNSDNDLLTKITYSYNYRGLLESEGYYSWRSKEQKRIEYKYDMHSNTIQIKEFNSYNTIAKIINRRYQNKLLISESINYTQEKYQWKRFYYYNKYSDLIKIERYEIMDGREELNSFVEYIYTYWE